MYADITIKAYCHNPAETERILLQHQAEYKGLDVQTDTYYEVTYGRLKHRQGNIENVLIHYNRESNGNAKKTEVLLYLQNPENAIVNQVCAGKKVLNQIKKHRKIFFIENVKFHIDHLESLGYFIEIEAIDIVGSLGEDKLKQQCTYYKKLLRITNKDLIDHSYFDCKS